MRCKACNSIMQDYENLSHNPIATKSGAEDSHEELCRGCINLSSPYGVSPEISCLPIPLLDSLPNGPKIFDT